MPGGRIDVEVAIDGRNAPTDLQRAMAPAMTQAKQFAGALGLAFGGAAVAASVKEVISIGNDYTTTMNTLQSVTQATAEQLSAASARAKELGNDIDLPGVSASDAAAAMTELAKGGFSVEQAMGAARGTLQLAGAAQIDAASAATIQSQALQSFGLNADYAAKVSDVLANSANASSAEITDVAAGLQQSGAVANQFGLSIEDTAATLGVLANAGITGSDAGTLLKSTLLALTDTSKPAQGAIDDLSLTVYNANGEFVGMASLFEQLDAAAASMTEEQYQAATATLFGSDAMRLAGVAAEQGRAGYDNMRTAVDRQGAAAEVAAAKTKGLPGAMASAQNAAETLALGVYDLIDGPLEGLATKTAEFISDATPRFIDGLSSMGSALGPVVEVGGDLLSVIADLPAPVQAVGVALAAIKFSNLDDGIGQRISSWRDQITSFRAEMNDLQNPVVEAAEEAASSGGGFSNPFQFGEAAEEAEDLAGALEENAEPLSDLAAGLATLERRSPAIRSMAEGYRGVTTRAGEFATRQRELATQSGALGGAFRNATARAGEFGGVLGGAAVAGARGLTSAARGMVGVLGGPWMVGIMAATAVVGQITGEMGKAQAQHEALAEQSMNVAVAQRDMAKAFQQSNGAVSEQVVGTVVTQVEALQTGLEKTAASAPGFFAAFNNVGRDIGAIFSEGDFSGLTGRAAQEELDQLSSKAEDAARAKAAIDELGLSTEELASKVYGSSTEWATFQGVLGAKEGGDEAVAQLRGLRDAAEQARQVAKNTTPGFYDMAEAVRVLADESSTADDRVNALKTALDIITGKQIPLSDAVQGYNDTLRELAESTTEVVDRTKGYGDALIGVNGAVNTQSANGSALRDQLVGLKDETVRLAEATVATALSQGDTLPQAQEKARQAIAGNEQALLNLGNQYGVNKTAIDAMAAAEGLLNKDIIMLASLAGANDVTGQLTVIKGLLDANAEGVEIPTEALTDETRARLDEIGVKVEEVDGKEGVVKVTAPNEQALGQLQEVINKSLPDKNVRVTAATDEAEAKLLELQNRQYIARLQVQVANGSMDYGSAVSAALNQQASLRNAAAGRADGGPITGPGGPREDNILIAASSGEHMFDAVDVDNMGGQQAVYDFRAGLDRGMKPMLVPAYADGGEITSGGAPIDAMMRVKNTLSSKNGQDYVYGGVGPVGYDCSGYVSEGYAEAMGLPKGVRYFTTESDFEALGFVPGLGGPNDLSIGVNRGGGGPYSHMAMTVGGVNAEASDFVQYGGSAKGASEFPLQWHLPGTSFSPPYTGATPALDQAASTEPSTARAAAWTESKDLELQSARVSVKQAIEDRAAVDADVKKTANDREQARIKVERAEARVRELEANKVAAETAPTVSASAGDTAASTSAKDASAVPGQLTTASQWSEALGGIAKDFVSENVSDVLGYYGASDDMGPIIGALTAGIAAASQPKEPDPQLAPAREVFSRDELARQAPVASGEPNWFQRMVESLEKNPVTLFDTGGVWKSGTLGLNMSGQDEEVLTGPHRTAVMREVALARAERASQAAGPDRTAPQRITNNTTTINAPGSDRRELAAGIRRAEHEQAWKLNSVRVNPS